MNKKEYLLKQYLNYLKSSSKEGILSSIEPLINGLSEGTLEKLLALSSMKVEPYFIANKEELLENFFEMNEIEITGYNAYDEWYDSNLEYSLEEYDEKVLSNVIELITYLYDNGEINEAYALSDHLYSISFNVTFISDEEDDEYATYDINDVIFKLESRHLKEKMDKIYLESLIYSRNVVLLYKYLYKHDADRTIDVIHSKDFYLLRDLARYIIDNVESICHLNYSTYIFQLLDDYVLFRDATIKYFDDKPDLLSKFVEHYYEGGNGRHDDEIAEVVNELLFSIDDWVSKYESIFYELLEVFPTNELITRYYALYDDDKSFIIFNYIDDDIFYKHLKPKDKRWLSIKQPLIQKRYQEVSHIVRAIFGTYDKINLLINNGSLNYVNRAFFVKSLILRELVDYVKFIGKDYDSKSYYGYVDIVDNIYNDIDKQLDLFDIVINEYPNRPKLREVFNERMNKYK